MSEPARGFVAEPVADEFPGLRLDWITVAARRAPSPPSLRARLRMLSNRYRGADVVALRTKPIPHAYRAFYRQIGLDPDIDRIPSERAATDRLLYGEFRSVDLIADACLTALIETGVPVWALDAAVVDPDPPGLGIRLADRSPPLPAPGSVRSGSLVVADRRSVHGVLFDDPPDGQLPGRTTTAVTLFSVAVDGVPEIHSLEALWLAAELLGTRPTW